MRMDFQESTSQSSDRRKLAERCGVELDLTGNGQLACLEASPTNVLKFADLGTPF